MCNSGKMKEAQCETPTCTAAEKTPLNGVGNHTDDSPVAKVNHTTTIEVQEASKVSTV